MNQGLIRNFCIIAHIDHGKSTLADRLLELTGTISRRDMQEQTLDSHPISRKRGITIRLAPVTMFYELQTLNPDSIGVNYELNLIDTPGHVDFSYEVERTLAACEGAILLVDATQGVQAQTVAHFRRAKKLKLVIIPVINKIDMPNARVEQTETELKELLNDSGPALPAGRQARMTSFWGDEGDSRIFKISAKTGQGVKELLENVIEKVPAPNGIPESNPRVLIFSSQFDPARGVTAYVRIVDGKIESKSKIRLIAAKTEATAFEIGHFRPSPTPCFLLETGEVGYVTTNLKDPSLVHVGDTITIPDYEPRTVSPLPGYSDPKPMVFVSFFPVDQNDFVLLEDALEKLHLNDAALSYSLTGSKALGRGFRCGFLGHLHAEVTQERLETDFNLSIIATLPAVNYELNATSNELREPWILATIITPKDYVGTIISLCEDRRGKLVDMTYHTNGVFLDYELPLSEIITDFFDQLKSRSSGFASFDYEMKEFRPFDHVTLDIVINHESVDAFSQIMERHRAEVTASNIVGRLKEIIPRQQIPIPIQAVIDNQVVARADIPAFRKDVTAKLYGGDFTRRLKLLEKQKRGKKKMKQIGKVEIPNDTFLKLFRT